MAYGFTIDQYRVSKRMPAGGSVTFEFRADKAGTYQLLLQHDERPASRQMKGQLIVQREVEAPTPRRSYPARLLAHDRAAAMRALVDGCE